MQQLEYFFWLCFFFFSSRRRHTRFKCDWSSDVCSSDLCVISHWITPTERFILGFPTSNYANGAKKVSSRNSLRSNCSILQKLLYGCRNVARLRQDHVLALPPRSPEIIHAPNAPHPGPQLLQQLICQPR